MILCFGEILLRMSPAAEGQWITKNKITVYPGGAELNVATALALWKLPVKYCTAAPDNYLTSDLLEYLNQKNIDTSSIHISGNRIGTYYLLQGKDLKHEAVIYDRAYSSFYELEPGMLDWDQILEGVSWFHFSAISPALSANAAAVCKEGLIAAAAKKIKISADLNYRSKLWQYGKLPIEVMPELASYCEVLMGNIWAANTLLGIEVDKNIHLKKDKAFYLAHAEKTSIDIQKKFPACKYVANTFRFDRDRGGIHYYATLFDGTTQFVSNEYDCENVIDKVGSGDCFMAGLIYGLYNQHKLPAIVNYAAAAAVGKLQIIGDATTQSAEEIKSSIK